jgi:hypothetical protein
MVDAVDHVGASHHASAVDQEAGAEHLTGPGFDAGTPWLVQGQLRL